MTGYAEQLLIPQMVESIAARVPAQPALVQHDRVIDYATLDRRSNQIANFLLSRGTQPEDRIGISLGRSIDFAIAALGILKSGAAYVPLDSSYPEARRRLIAEDAGLTFLLGEKAEPALRSSMQTFSVQSSEVEGHATSRPELAKAAQDQLAYVIYTSGSTGVPKGVEVTHGNLRHLVEWHNRSFQVGPKDRATLIANVGFDASVWELWPYLCAGATLMIPSREIIRQPEALRDYIVQSNISIMFAPTLLAEALMRSQWPADSKLRCLLTGGDTLRVFPSPGLPFSIVNNYGPAECTVVSTSGVIAPSDHPRTPSIGCPIDGVHVCLLDERLQEVPKGAQGELCISGAGVARGYLNRPELTAQRFVTRSDGTRVYKSGDIGRLNEDGSIQFLGRVDNQVKIRGYRIECGEIEAALNSLPSVKTSAVIVREQSTGHHALVAYLVSEGDTTLNHEALRQFLRAMLPEYMVPEQFVRLNSIPVTDNGKIDRSRLSDISDAAVIATVETPGTPVENSLMAVLTKLLGIDRMDRNDDFFLLGGHSFIAAQLIARVRDRFGVELGLRAVFENPTLAGMAQQIEQRMMTKH